jgi:hypothetical protein
MAIEDRDGQAPATAEPLAIICGGGPLPFAVADAAARSGRAVVMFPIEGWADRAAVSRYPHHWIALGRFGRLRAQIRAAGCREVVFIGTLLRPSLREIRLDWATLGLLPRIYRSFRGGDDHLLSGIGGIFEEHGLRLVGAHEIAPEILVPAGVLGRHAPSERDHADIVRGLALIDAMGPFDVGQAAVVAERRVLAVEAAEGTDAMLDRVAALREQGRVRSAQGVGVLVKAAKPGQDRRVDLPSIGPTTIARAAAGGLAGLAVRAGEVIVVEPAAVIAAADAAGVFVIGVAARADDTAQRA